MHRVVHRATNYGIGSAWDVLFLDLPTRGCIGGYSQAKIGPALIPGRGLRVVEVDEQALASAQTVPACPLVQAVDGLLIAFAVRTRDTDIGQRFGMVSLNVHGILNRCFHASTLNVS